MRWTDTGWFPWRSYDYSASHTPSRCLLIHPLELILAQPLQRGGPQAPSCSGISSRTLPGHAPLLPGDLPETFLAASEVY